MRPQRALGYDARAGMWTSCHCSEALQSRKQRGRGALAWIARRYAPRYDDFGGPPIANAKLRDLLKQNNALKI